MQRTAGLAGNNREGVRTATQPGTTVGIGWRICDDIGLHKTFCPACSCNEGNVGDLSSQQIALACIVIDAKLRGIRRLLGLLLGPCPAHAQTNYLKFLVCTECRKPGVVCGITLQQGIVGIKRESLDASWWLWYLFGEQTNCLQ